MDAGGACWLEVGYNSAAILVSAFSIAKCQVIFSIPEALKCHAPLDNSRSNCLLLLRKCTSIQMSKENDALLCFNPLDLKQWPVESVHPLVSSNNLC